MAKTDPNTASDGDAEFNDAIHYLCVCQAVSKGGRRVNRYFENADLAKAKFEAISESGKFAWLSERGNMFGLPDDQWVVFNWSDNNIYNFFPRLRGNGYFSTEKSTPSKKNDMPKKYEPLDPSFVRTVFAKPL